MLLLEGGFETMFQILQMDNPLNPEGRNRAPIDSMSLNLGGCFGELRSPQKIEK